MDAITLNTCPICDCESIHINADAHEMIGTLETVYNVEDLAHTYDPQLCPLKADHDGE